MTAGALIFWLLSWTFVLGLMIWSFTKILRGKDHFDPDGIGPDSPPRSPEDGPMPPPRE